MSSLPAARQLQGEDPKGKVFSGLTGIIYAMDTSMSYETSSQGTTQCANALTGGLRGKRVLDLGCGHGTTTLMLGHHAPAEIVAVDNSDAMLELMRLTHVTQDVNIRSWLEERQASEILGDLYDLTVQRLEQRRRQFAEGIFSRLGGRLTIQKLSALELTPEVVGEFDVIVANNMLHWPINQRRGQLKESGSSGSEEDIRMQAINEVLTAIGRVLKPGGIGVFMEPKDFMLCDTDPDLEAQCEARTMVSHPLFIRWNNLFNEILRQRHGITRPVPKTTPLFRVSQLPEMFERAGLQFSHVPHQENPWVGDPIHGLQARMPMWLGQIEIPAADKIAITNEVAATVRRTLTEEERTSPMFIHYFYICAQKEQ